MSGTRCPRDSIPMDLNALLDVDVVAVEAEDQVSVLLELVAPGRDSDAQRPPSTLAGRARPQWLDGRRPPRGGQGRPRCPDRPPRPHRQLRPGDLRRHRRGRDPCGPAHRQGSGAPRDSFPLAGMRPPTSRAATSAVPRRPGGSPATAAQRCCCSRTATPTSASPTTPSSSGSPPPPRDTAPPPRRSDSASATTRR